MLLQEALLCSLSPAPNTGAGLISLHDIQTGTPLASFKQTNSAPHGLSYVESKNGLGGVIMAAQSDKAMLNVFSFQKDQSMNKLILPEKVSCISVDTRGEYCACGTANGRLYLWEVASGILYSSFEAHYRRISVVRFTHDGAGLVTAGDDSIINVWAMSRLLDDDLQSDIPTPYCCFTEHTLPVTDVSCGIGLFPSCRVFSSSLDGTVMLWDLSTRSLLTSFLFPRPITIISVDPSERCYFAASEDGSIQQVNLFRKRREVTNVPSAEAIGGGGMSGIVRIADGEADVRLIAVGQPIAALSLSMTASLLLAGLKSGQIQIYDVASHQLLRSINTYQDKGLGITFLATFLKPPDLYGHVKLGGGAGTPRDNDPVIPVAPFQRTKDASARERHEATMILPIQNPVYRVSLPSTSELLQEHRYFMEDQSATTSNGTSLQSRVSELEIEVSKLKEQLGSAKDLNDAMWETVVEKVLDNRDPVEADVEKDQPSRKRSRIGR